MYFKFACPECGKNLKAGDEHVGRKVGCPYCKTPVMVPKPPTAEELEAPAPEATGEFGGLDTSGAVASRRRSSSKERGAAATPQMAEGAEVSMLKSCLIGIVMSVAFVAVMAPFRNFYMGELFLDRGWVPYALVFLMSWSLAILFLKNRKLRRQRASMLFDVLPNELADDITADDVDKFVRHIHGLPVDPKQSFLINRVLRGLEHFYVRKSTPEVASMLASQSEIDTNSVDSSYTLLKVFIWAIPILGFIGTVIGISTAVGGFSGSLEQADDISVLKESLNNVTGGLATAFDTTLVALVMSLLVKFPAASMQMAEEGLINWVDEYCNENLLKRLDDGREGQNGAPAAAASPQAIQRAVSAAMVPHHAELQTWTRKLESIGDSVSSKVVEGWSEVNTRMQGQNEQALARGQDVERMTAEFQDRLNGLASETRDVQQQIAGSVADSTESLREAFGHLEQGLAGLNDVLGKLGEKQVTIQAAPQKRGWFSRRRNGAN